MQTLSKTLVIFTLAMFASGGGGGAPPVLELTYTEAPIELSGVEVLYAEDIRYGEGERNLLDSYLPNCPQSCGDGRLSGGLNELMAGDPRRS